ncbi:hypothetical protein [Sandaracinus amylolyticus]|uniref:hypothetical protein n=1 Tax=Sandaracinus amylolyticus TaxID=927083 RepID=UPI001F344983|nr:hypothetical protein [Sandaracinus amylolyticus]UJR83679.1 Hypothetical protein I5071_57480 [Sandaracinus amylolyticus]
MTKTKHDVSLDDVLHEMALTSEKPDAKVVGEYLRRYPQYAEEITDFAAELAAMAIAADVDDGIEPSTTGTSPAISRALSQLHNRLYEVKQEQPARDGSGPDLFAPFSPGQFRALASELGVNAFFLSKVRDRTIEPETIPHAFRVKMADAMKVSEPVIAAYLAGQATIPDQMRFLSEQKPEASRRQSFADAVKSSKLTEEQQRHLLSL